MFESLSAAREVIANTRRTAADREDAIHYVANNSPGAEELALLVTTLDDNDSGVRYAAANALARCGMMALKPLVDALARPGSSVRLRQGAHHVFKESVSPEVRRQSAELMAALEGSGSDLASLEAAIRLQARLG